MVRKIAFIRDAEKMTGFSRSTLRRKWEHGLFPKPTLLDGTTLVWAIETIEKWIDEKLKTG
jgi:predicted DNA-binding transcriptional regulator AlpA